MSELNELVFHVFRVIIFAPGLKANSFLADTVIGRSQSPLRSFCFVVVRNEDRFSVVLDGILPSL